MSHKLGRTNSLPWLPFSIINLIKFQKTNLKDEGEITSREGRTLWLRYVISPPSK
jgi:hypothetical protein